MNIIRMMPGIALISVLGIIFFIILGYVILPILFVGLLFWGARILYMWFKGDYSEESKIHILHPKYQQTKRHSKQDSNVIDVEYTEL